MRRRFDAVLVIPALAFLIVAGLVVSEDVRTNRVLRQDTVLAGFAGDVTALVHELQRERDLTTGLLVSGGRTGASELAEQRTRVDHEAERFTGAIGPVRDQAGPRLGSRLDEARLQVERLSNLRASADGAALTEQAVFEGYSRLIRRLLDLNQALAGGSGSPELTRAANALNALSETKELTSRVRGRLYAAALRGWNFGEQQDFVDLLGARQAALGAFRQSADERELQRYDEIVRGQPVMTVTRMEATATSRRSGTEPGVDPSQWFAASSTQVQMLRLVEQEQSVAVAESSRTLRAAAVNRARLSTLGVAAVLLVASVASLLLARSVVRPLQRLRSRALQIAHDRLPAAVERLRTDAHVELEEMQAVAEAETVYHDDEIGELAEAFDAVHLEAVRLATEQALLRRNVSAMFVNLSRRSQVLVERQLRFIDELEANEQDPDQLANLFKLDHQTTRMRRFAENILVLAGSEFTRRWRTPKPLADVLRAATAEVEQYERVTLSAPPGLHVVGHAVNDLVHLLAELIENATSFSPRTSPVRVSVRREGEDALVEVVDSGVGMGPRALARANQRLAAPDLAQVALEQQMGLLVVARLAARHDIGVRLATSAGGGVTATVRLPAALLSMEGPGGETERFPGSARGWKGIRDTGGDEYDEGAEAIVPALRPRAVATRAEDFLDEGDDHTPSTWSTGEPSGGPTRPAPSTRSTPTGLPVRARQEPQDGTGEEPPSRTRGGLPVRRPGTHVVPEALRPAPAPRRTQEREPDEVGGTLSRLYRGVERGRGAGADGPVPPPPTIRMEKDRDPER